MAARRTFFEQLQIRIRQLPGVEAAGVVDFLPLRSQGAATTFSVVGGPVPEPGQAPVADIRTASAEFFHTMHVALMAGRLQLPSDGPNSPTVVLVNQAFARGQWPGENPVGRRIKVDMLKANEELEVVGVVGDVRGRGLDADVQPTIYYAASQVAPGSMTVVVRAGRDRSTLESAIRGAVRELDSELPVGEIASMNSWLARSMSDRRYPMLLLGVFAALALVLAGIGVYGVLAYGVAQRTREIGIRVALGARPSAVLGMTLMSGIKLVSAGIMLGGLSGVFATRVLRRLLFGVTPGDPLTLGAVVLLLVIVALIAMYLPARRAVRVDPMVALRTE
jgi:predicted permease